MSITAYVITGVVTFLLGCITEYRAGRADVRVLEGQLVGRANVLAACVKAREERVRKDIAAEIAELKALPAEEEAKVLGIIKRGL